MSRATIIVTVDLTGHTTLQTDGFIGPPCREASRFIETALGTRASEHLTPEFHQIPAAHQQITRHDLEP